jgi:DNA segregation ATPase FtsK/SpoIIIE, S-DNA-T family
MQRMATVTRSPRGTGKTRPEPAPPNHRASDAVGVTLLAVATVLAIALGVGNGGLIGDGLAGVFRVLVGRGAWAVPAVLGFAGLSLLAGRTNLALGRVAAGASLVALATVGFLAESVRGDYFDPVAVERSGGYLGAVAAWALQSLIGAGKPVGLAAIGLVGLVLCLDTPMRQWLRALRRRPKPVQTKPQRAVVEVEAREAEPLDERAQRALAFLNRKDSEKSCKKPVVMANDPPTREVKLETQTSREGFELPALSLLAEPVAKSKRSQDEMRRNIETLETTLEQFGIDANVVEVATGPTITRYELQLGPGIKVSRITALGDNIAMNLAASHVRVEAPIPGKAAIGVEVPNTVRQTVTLREMCENLEFHAEDLKLGVALGKDVSGQPKYADLTKMPHVLVAGATNSGKSICLATMIMSLIVRHTPREVRLVMIDPKRVELALFEGLPHLMCPVVKDVKEAAGVLRAVVREMERRIEKFSDEGVRNIDGWNAKADDLDKLPYIVVVLDEMADLMVQAQAEVETSIMRLAQLARATGIHLVLATQRPSVDVITGTVKNNIPSRIAFAVSSQVDSRTILDQAGADKLVGRGDMLFLPIDQNKPLRIQGCYVSEKEIEAVCDFWRKQAKPHYVLNPVQIAIEEREADMREEEEADPLWEEAVRWVVSRGEASTSMLQRKFSIGFQRASRLLDLMESRSIVGARDGPRPREVLVDPMQVEVMFGRGEYLSPLPDDARVEDED